MLLENDPSISQQGDLYLLRGSYCKTARFCENISQSWGILLSGKILCKEIQSKVHWGLKGLKEMALFKFPPKLSMTLVCYRNSICLSVLFLFKPFCFNSWQTWAESGSEGGKKVSPPQESPTDRPDQRLSEARAYFIYRLRLTWESFPKSTMCGQRWWMWVSECKPITLVKLYSVQRGISE